MVGQGLTLDNAHALLHSHCGVATEKRMVALGAYAGDTPAVHPALEHIGREQLLDLRETIPGGNTRYSLHAFFDKPPFASLQGKVALGEGYLLLAWIAVGMYAVIKGKLAFFNLMFIHYNPQSNSKMQQITQCMP